MQISRRSKNVVLVVNILNVENKNYNIENILYIAE